MSTCLALLKGPLDHKQVQHWFNTELFEHLILHVEVLTNTDAVSGQLTADAFCIPSEIDITDICGLVIFDCETCLVSKYGFQLPALGIQCLDDRNILCIRGFCDDAPTVEEYESDCCILDDPCALYKELRCCYYKLVKDEEKVSITFRDRSIRFQPKSEQDKVRLYQMMLEAKAECDKACGVDNNYRGGHLGHSCAPKIKQGGCY